MGRKAGVAAEETKAALLEAAAKVFARRGYDGASISEITSEAGLTSGAIYAHYASKAELFNATLEVYAERDLDQLLQGGADVVDAILSIGSSIDHRESTEASLLISAIVAARNDPEVAKLLVSGMAEREVMFRGLVNAAQEVGSLDPDLTAEAISRFCLMVSMGSLVVEALGIEPVGHADWTKLIARLVATIRS
ncbi:MAG TPA: TetR family transcriptional regulator [Acidimicrobiales bacterium]|jgi:AcrR family transcriptional regulator|nr:TetR family transcriptional regulator [Acidimicrobiales bacterium]